MTMRDVITEQLTVLRRKGYSLERAAKTLTTIDKAGGGRNANEIKRVAASMEALKKNPRTKKKSTRKKKSRAKVSRKGLGKFKHIDIRSPSKMAKGSIRTVKRGKKRVRIGCPKGPGHYSKKTGRCKVGTRAVSILVPNPKTKTFRIFQRKRQKVGGAVRDVFYYWNGEAFTRNYNDAERYYRENAIAIVKATHKVYPNIVIGVSDGKA